MHSARKQKLSSTIIYTINKFYPVYPELAVTLDYKSQALKII